MYSLSLSCTQSYCKFFFMPLAHFSLNCEKRADLEQTDYSAVLSSLEPKANKVNIFYSQPPLSVHRTLSTLSIDCKNPKNSDTRKFCGTIMILSFPTDMPGQTVQTQIRLIRFYTVWHSVCVVWTRYSKVEPHGSNFRFITTNFLGVQISRKFMVITLKFEQGVFTIE